MAVLLLTASANAQAQGNTAQDDAIALPAMTVLSEGNGHDSSENGSQISSALGTNTYTIGPQALDRMPQGGSASLGQVLLQAPGVAADAQGDIHVRGDHRNLQYRIDGVIIPEAVSGFAQLFEARGIRSVKLITGSLPAEFGFRTAGIVDLTLRSGLDDPGGSAGLYTGSYQTVQPSIAYGNASGHLDYYVTGSLLSSARGFDTPTPSLIAANNHTEQFRGLVTAHDVLSDTLRLSLIAGTNQSSFGIPATPGLPAAFIALGADRIDSSSLTSQQWQRSSFAIAALQYAGEQHTAQISVFVRQTSLRYRPDRLGELIITGTAADTFKENISTGIQADDSWRLSAHHTIRAGLFVSADATESRLSTYAFPAADGHQISDIPVSIHDGSTLRQQLYGFYAQDEWHISEHLTANIGVRFDTVQGPASGNQLSPRVNLAWSPRPGTWLHAGYARYFTPPPAELLSQPTLSLYNGTTAQASTLQSNPVRPERSHVFSVGIQQNVGTAFKIGLEGYYRQSSDLQDLGQFGSAYLFSPYNYRKGRIHGIELSGSYGKRRVQLYANIAYGRAEGKDPVSNQYLLDTAERSYAQQHFVQLDHEQTVSGSAGFSFQAWKGGVLSTDCTYASGLRKGFANTSSITPAFILNVSFVQEFDLPQTVHWTARIDLMNAADRMYQIRDGSGLGVSASQYGARRGVFWGLSHAL